MPLCGCFPAPDLASDPFVDADRIIKDYAWKQVELPWWQRLCRGQYELEVNWGYLDRKHELKRFTCRQMQLPGGAVGKDPKVVTRDLCLFRTQFTNDTTLQQTYTFRTERETSSTCHVSVQKGYQIGGKLDVNFSIPLPGEEELKAVLKNKVDLCDVTGGLSCQFNLTSTHGETFSEKLAWSVDTQVDVAPRTKATASLIIQEKTFEADYTILTTIRPIREGITVYVRRKKTNDVITKVEILRDGFASLFVDKGGFQAGSDPDHHAVTCLTRGTCRAVYGAEQMVKVTHQKLDEDEADTQRPALGHATQEGASIQEIGSESEQNYTVELEESPQEHGPLVASSSTSCTWDIHTFLQVLPNSGRRGNKCYPNGLLYGVLYL